MFTLADLAGTKAYKKWGKYTKYSAQQLIDCTYKRYKGINNKGCNGGFTYISSLYAITNGLAL